jgi:ABC-2 type transport system permease protein
MIAKEWRDARWKLVIGTVLVLVMGVLIPLDTLFPHSYSLFGEPGNVVAPSPTEDAGYLKYLLWSQWFTEASGNLILMLLAAVLGAGLISDEVNRGTIFLLLDKPVGRERVLLTKYTISAGALLIITLLGSATLLIVAGTLGYPQHAGGVFVSTVLMWLGLLFMFGTSLLLSVVLDSALLAVVGTFMVWMLTSVAPAFVAQQTAVFLSTQNEALATVFDVLSLSPYWTSLAAYSGDSFPTMQLLVSSVTAGLPLLLALWIFRRKAY